jgi:hypothetical protein
MMTTSIGVAMKFPVNFLNVKRPAALAGLGFCLRIIGLLALAGLLQACRSGTA